MTDLFDQSNQGSSAVKRTAVKPLAARMRPRHPDHYIGQEHLFAPGKPLREAILNKQLHSMILWGPPGVGKTSMAKMIAEVSDSHFETISAVLAGVKDIRAAISRAQLIGQQTGQETILFVDEVHRFNKAQQDAFLPHVEDGTIIFIGATTENPSFSLNNALLSRSRVYVLRSLTTDQLIKMQQQALHDIERGMGDQSISMEEGVLETLAHAADGDGRKALNLLEICVDLSEYKDSERHITMAIVDEILAHDVRRFDKDGDMHLRYSEQ